MAAHSTNAIYWSKCGRLTRLAGPWPGYRVYAVPCLFNDMPIRTSSCHDNGAVQLIEILALLKEHASMHGAGINCGECVGDVTPRVKAFLVEVG